MKLSEKSKVRLTIACLIFPVIFFAQLIAILLSPSTSGIVELENQNVFAIIWIAIAIGSIFLLLLLTSEATE